MLSLCCQMAASMARVRVMGLCAYVTVLLLLLANPVSAQTIKPQVWTTNVVAGEFPSQQAALAAVRAQGGVYAFVEQVEKVVQSDALTTYVYGAKSRGPDVGPWYKFTATGCTTNPESSEAAALSCAAADWPRLSYCPAASIGGMLTDWQAQYFFYDGTPKMEQRTYKLTSYNTTQCVPEQHIVGVSRERVVDCATGFSWSGTEKACVKHDIARISTKPQCNCPLQHNPVNVSTGDKYQAESDISLPWFNFSRHYHSAYSVPEGRLGPGWSHDLNIRFYPNGSSGAGVLLPQGEVLPFHYIYGPYEATDGSGRRVRVVSNIYQLEEGDRTIKFDAAGKPTRIDYLSGESLTLQYDTNARLSTVTHSSGRSVTFEYDTNPYPANARLVAIKTNGVALVNYDYDSAGRLEYARYPNGTARRYHYEDAAYPDHLTGITDEANVRFATYGYNADGLATLSEHAGGLYHGTFDYQADGTTIYTDANGRVQTFGFSTEGTYRKLTQAADMAGVESTIYAPTSADFRRRPTNRIDKRGMQTTYSYDDLSDPVMGSVRRTTTNEAVGTAQARTTQSWRDVMTTRLLKTVVPGTETIYQRNTRGQPLTMTVKDTATGP